MLITPYLDGFKFDLETKRTMGVAFEMTRAALRLSDRDDLVVAMVADRIIELAREGERNPDLLLRTGIERSSRCRRLYNGAASIGGLAELSQDKAKRADAAKRRAQHRLGKVRPDGPL
jgi:hypothetical protein